jgi:hypothetical protein
MLVTDRCPDSQRAFFASALANDRIVSTEIAFVITLLLVEIADTVAFPEFATYASFMWQHEHRHSGSRQADGGHEGRRR